MYKISSLNSPQYIYYMTKWIHFESNISVLLGILYNTIYILYTRSFSR